LNENIIYHVCFGDLILGDTGISPCSQNNATINKHFINFHDFRIIILYLKKYLIGLFKEKFDLKIIYVGNSKKY